MSNSFSYEDWKDSTDIKKICERLLDNANMDIKFADCPFSITLVFFVIGSNIKVEFTCSGIEKFCIEKDSEDRPLYVVLEVQVSPPTKSRDPSMSNHEFWALDHKDYVWEIRVFPEANLIIECLSLDWELTKITDEEMRWLN